MFGVGHFLNHRINQDEDSISRLGQGTKIKPVSATLKP